jgi:uncharacterized protein (DUF1778 family)
MKGTYRSLGNCVGAFLFGGVLSQPKRIRLSHNAKQMLILAAAAEEQTLSEWVLGALEEANHVCT